MRRLSTCALVSLFLLGTNAAVRAADVMRAASGGFTTAIHAVMWAAYEEKLFKKYGLDVEYLALNSG
jgi:ABC-type nitrate/sulfonate/bicarbonate transport system substrate-binding protein